MKKIFITGIDRNAIARFIIPSGGKIPAGIIAGKDWTLMAEPKEEAEKEADQQQK